MTETTVNAQMLVPGMQLIHFKFGTGTILEIRDDLVIVEFPPKEAPAAEETLPRKKNSAKKGIASAKKTSQTADASGEKNAKMNEKKPRPQKKRLYLPWCLEHCTFAWQADPGQADVTRSPAAA